MQHEAQTPIPPAAVEAAGSSSSESSAPEMISSALSRIEAIPRSRFVTEALSWVLDSYHGSVDGLADGWAGIGVGNSRAKAADHVARRTLASIWTDDKPGDTCRAYIEWMLCARELLRDLYAPGAEVRARMLLDALEMAEVSRG